MDGYYVPQTTMIRFPLKRSAGTPNFKQKLTTFISENYNENVELFSQDISELDFLRASSVDLQYDLAECSTLKKYFCQLNSVKHKFPLYKESPPAVKFSWHSIDSQTTANEHSDIDFEMCCILYNIGASHTQMATLDSDSGSTQTADEIKMSSIHFECAAWAFQYLRHNFPNFFTQDMSPDLLSIFKNVCLAQAQECLLQMSFIDEQEFEHGFRVKIAVQVVEYLQLSLMTCDYVLSKKCTSGRGIGHGQYSYSVEIIEALKKWKHQIEVKILYYTAVAFIFEGNQFHANSKLVECIGCYRAGMEKLDKAIKLDKNVENTESISKTLAFIRNTLNDKLSMAEKCNSSASPIPNMDSILSDIKGESLVNPISFEFDDPNVAGRILFDQLKPIESHELYSRQSLEKIKILREYSVQIEEKNEALDKCLIQIRLQELDLRSIGIPQELLDCCAALCSKQVEVKKLSNLKNEIETVTLDVEKSITELLLLVEQLKSRNQDYFKDTSDSDIDRKSRLIIAKLSVSARKCNEAVLQASHSNKQFFSETKTMISNLNILMKPWNEILNHIPSVPFIEKENRSRISEMKELSRQLHTIREERESLEIQLRRSICTDDFLTQSNNNVMLKTHTQMLDEYFQSQDELIEELTKLNVSLSNARKAISSCSGKRSKVFRSFLDAFEIYPTSTIRLEKCLQLYKTLDNEIKTLLDQAKNPWKVHDEKKGIQETGFGNSMPNATAPESSNQNCAGDQFGTDYQNYSNVSDLWNSFYDKPQHAVKSTTSTRANPSSANANIFGSTTSTSTYDYQPLINMQTQAQASATHVPLNIGTNGVGVNDSTSPQNWLTPINYQPQNLLQQGLNLTKNSIMNVNSVSIPQFNTTIEHGAMSAIPSLSTSQLCSSVNSQFQGMTGYNNWSTPGLFPLNQNGFIQFQLPQQYATNINQTQQWQPLASTTFQIPPTNTNTFINTNAGAPPRVRRISRGRSTASASGSTSTHSMNPAMDDTSSSHSAPSITVVKPYRTKATPAAPPNWEKSCDQTIQALTPFLKIVVPRNSNEYRVIHDLVSTAVKPTSIERIVNTELWEKFVSHRRDTLVSKSQDIKLLKKLGMSENGIHHRAAAASQAKSSGVLIPYSDNVALLFHSTIGLLGPGIYFTDDPNKSILSDDNGTLMIFSVFLGDCFLVEDHHLSNQNQQFARAPEKTNDQKRSPTDLCFDSIVGRPSSSGNEYVIYNPFQCCPLYVVSYDKNKRRSKSQSASARVKYPWTLIYTEARLKLPPFAWTSTNRKNKSSKSNWPFYAQIIFDLMEQPTKAEIPTVTNYGKGSRKRKASEMDTDKAFGGVLSNSPPERYKNYLVAKHYRAKNNRPGALQMHLGKRPKLDVNFDLDKYVKKFD